MTKHVRFTAAALAACAFLFSQLSSAQYSKAPRSASATHHILYVDAGAAPNGNGTSWQSAFVSLQSALEAANDNAGIDSILIARGVYKPTSGTNRDSAFIIPRGGLTLVGGYPEGGGKRNFKVHRTVLSGDIGVPGNTSDNSFHVMIIAGLPYNAPSLFVDGLYITGGNAGEYTGGISVNGQEITHAYAGGVYFQYNNNAFSYFTNCVFANNQSVAAGGGIYQESSYITYQNCAFISNGGGTGGGIYLYNFSLATLNSCLFYDNSATNGGGAIYGLNNGNGLLSGCTLVKNSSPAGGAICSSNAYETIDNSILWRNRAIDFPNVCINNLGAIHNSIIEGGYPTGDTVITQDPLFVNLQAPLGPDGIPFTADDGLQLKAGSPAINAGNNYLATSTNNVSDITGAPRILNGKVDIGAYEYRGTVSPAAPADKAVLSLTGVTATGAAIRLYPNPAHETAVLDLQGVTGNVSVTIADISGKVLQRLQDIRDSHIALRVSSLAEGTYLVTVQGEHLVKTVKLVKVK